MDYFQLVYELYKIRRNKSLFLTPSEYEALCLTIDILSSMLDPSEIERLQFALA